MGATPEVLSIASVQDSRESTPPQMCLLTIACNRDRRINTTQMCSLAIACNRNSREATTCFPLVTVKAGFVWQTWSQDRQSDFFLEILELPVSNRSANGVRLIKVSTSGEGAKRCGGD